MLVAGCAPSFHPLYTDYETSSPVADLETRVLAAVEQTPWQLTETSVPTVFATKRRTVKERGLYRLDVALEIAPIDDRYVRVYFHPYRQYFTGKRSKVPFFQRSLRRKLLPELERAFAGQGIEVVGKNARPDKVAVSR